MGGAAQHLRAGGGGVDEEDLKVRAGGRNGFPVLVGEIKKGEITERVRPTKDTGELPPIHRLNKQGSREEGSETKKPPPKTYRP